MHTKAGRRVVKISTSLAPCCSEFEYIHQAKVQHRLDATVISQERMNRIGEEDQDQLFLFAPSAG